MVQSDPCGGDGAAARQMILEERAPAKINLFLKVLGRRADGFHEIESLVAFARFGDTLSLNLASGITLETTGPFAAALGSENNLVLEGVKQLRARCPVVQAGAFFLEKNIPVAAGLGGGSADAAAALRLIGRANPGVITPQIIEEAASALGSDVPACLMSHAAIIRGRGEKITALEAFPALDIVLVNPGIPLAARDVYAALGAPYMEEDFVPGETGQTSFATAGELLKFISNAGNDLQPPAMKLAPVIGDVLSALSQTQGCELARMSGSGSTCFGVFANAGHAASAGNRLRAAHPDWWVVSTRLVLRP